MTLGRDNIKTKHTALYFPNGIHHLRYIREMKPSVMKLRKAKINKISDKFFHEMPGHSPLDIGKNRKKNVTCLHQITPQHVLIIERGSVWRGECSPAPHENRRCNGLFVISQHSSFEYHIELISFFFKLY